MVGGCKDEKKKKKRIKRIILTMQKVHSIRQEIHLPEMLKRKEKKKREKNSCSAICAFHTTRRRNKNMRS